MMVNSRLLFRPFADGDENGLFELSCVLFPEVHYDWNSWLANWRWKYKDNPAGEGIIWVAEHDSKIVGHYAVIPVLIKIGSETTIVFQSVDTMTHPDYRRKGIFSSLANSLYDGLNQKPNTNIVYGFPNSSSLPGFMTRLGFLEVLKIPLIFKPFNWRNLLSLRLKNRALLEIAARSGELLERLIYKAKPYRVAKGLEIIQVDRFEESIDQLWDRVSNQHMTAVVRTCKYLNWRYAPPGINYLKYVAVKDEKTVGYAIARLGKQRYDVKGGIIFDLFAESEELAGCLIAKVVEHCKQKDIDLLYTYMQGEKIFHTALRENGFIKVPFVEALPLIIHVGVANDHKWGCLKGGDGWLVQLGDSDAT